MFPSCHEASSNLKRHMLWPQTVMPQVGALTHSTANTHTHTHTLHEARDTTRHAATHATHARTRARSSSNAISSRYALFAPSPPHAATAAAAAATWGARGCCGCCACWGGGVLVKPVILRWWGLVCGHGGRRWEWRARRAGQPARQAGRAPARADHHPRPGGRASGGAGGARHQRGPGRRTQLGAEHGGARRCEQRPQVRAACVSVGVGWVWG